MELVLLDIILTLMVRHIVVLNAVDATAYQIGINTRQQVVLRDLLITAALAHALRLLLVNAVDSAVMNLKRAAAQAVVLMPRVRLLLLMLTATVLL